MLLSPAFWAGCSEEKQAPTFLFLDEELALLACETARFGLPVLSPVYRSRVEF